ncbi:MAG: PIN domain-containing protein [Micrococcales bacterium]|nr:PIN domain-containing protein [Micrococcales bacterium]
MIILDTNVVSVLLTARGDQDPSLVEEWLQTVEDEVYTTAITRGEVLAGIDLLPAGKRRSALAASAEALFSALGQRILSFGAQHAPRYAQVVAKRTSAGQPIGSMEALIAAIALAHGAVVATRNTQDFLGVGLVLVNPYDPTTW